MHIKFNFVFTLMLFLLGLNSYAQNTTITLDCLRIGQESEAAQIQINLDLKIIYFDSHESRLRHEDLNQRKMKNYREAILKKDEMGIAWWAPRPYEPRKMNITKIDDSEVIAENGFPIQGNITINRNTLIAYSRISNGTGLDESSYKCKISNKGF